MNYLKRKGFSFLIYTEQTIHCSAEKVWSVLTDFESLKTWSNSLMDIKGEFKKGERVCVKFTNMSNKIIDLHNELIYFEEGKTFGLSAYFFIGLKDKHVYSIEKINENKCKIIQTDLIHGWLSVIGAPIASKFLFKKYIAFNLLLKEKAEQIN